MKSIIKFFTSLRLTIWLLGLSVVLVFLGSIAQVPEGLWNAQARWFKTLLIVRREGDPWFVPPIFPGGHLLGALLFVNLVAAHMKRFSWNFQKFGIQLTHFGVIVLLVGQLATDKLAVESSMQFMEGQMRNYTEHHRDVELVFMHDKNETQEEVVSFPQRYLKTGADLQHEKLPFTVRVKEYGVNGTMLMLNDMANASATVTRALSTVEGKFTSPQALPAIAEQDVQNPSRRIVWRKALRAIKEDDEDVVGAVKKVAADPVRGPELAKIVKDVFRQEMVEVFANAGRDEARFGSPEQGSEMAYAAELEFAGKGGQATQLTASATNGTGMHVHAISRPEIKDDSKGRNYNWAVLEIVGKDGKSLGTWLASAQISKPQEFEVGGTKWRLAIRNERFYLNYAVQLIRAKQEVYQGTADAKEYASRVRIINPNTKEDRETEISMNQPLRYEGLTFYQSTMNQMDRGPGTASLLEALTGRPRSEFAGMEEKEGGRFSGLQTVENPSMIAPYTGCLLVGFGMLWQFLYHLTVFLAKRVGLPGPTYGIHHPALRWHAILIMVPDIFLIALAWKNGSLFALAVVAVTPFIRGVLAWQVWQGRNLVFAMVILLIPTALTIPFAVKYWETHGMMLAPVVIAQTIAFAGISAIVFRNKPVTAKNPSLA